ncbi:MAG: cytochrome c [Chloroflexi bacterium]|nr:cytochrome c [Chloroflexota bacterium]
MTAKFVWLVVSILLVVILMLASCAPKPVTKITPATPPPATPASEGQLLYTQKCASCHGAKGEGTTIAPAVAGHSMAALKTQVRNPMGKMPAFPASQISDHDLDEIAEFIAGMAKAKAPVQEWEKAASETIHHWMALVAIKSNDPQDATHHLRDALTFIKEPTRKTNMEKAIKLIAQGNMHDAEHEIEEMVGSESPSGVTMKRFHLMLAMRAVEGKDAADVKHHVSGHFLTLGTESEKKHAMEAVELAEKGDFHEAEHEVEELLEGK